MLFEQFYLSCLSQASYVIGSGGTAAIVDPQRDVDQYIDFAGQNGIRIATSSKRTFTRILYRDTGN